jgi:NADH:ubiquinone oxidoreductase subunit K
VVLSLAVVHLIVGLSVILSQTRSRDSSDVDDASDLRW